VLGGIGSNTLWFDTSVFSAPPANTWGTVERRGLLTGPAYVNVDASIVKIVRFGQRRLEVRADMFNALNIPHYMNRTGHSATELRTHHGNHPADRALDPLRRALPVLRVRPAAGRPLHHKGRVTSRGSPLVDERGGLVSVLVSGSAVPAKVATFCRHKFKEDA
jgi:hypothetical protein